MTREHPVTCVDVRDAIVAGTVTPEIVAHGGSCPACAELLADDAVLGRFLVEPADDAGADEVAAQVLAKIHQERNPVPRLPSPVRMGLVWTAVFVPAVVMFGWRPRPDLAGYPVERMALVLGGLWLAGAVAGLVVLRPLHRPLVAARGLWVAVALTLPMVLGVLPRVENGIEAPWVAATLHCFERGASLAAVVLAALWLSDRRSRPGAWWWAGASGLAAIAGGLMLQVACPVTDMGHLVVGHGAIGIVFAAVIAGGIGTRRAIAG